MIRKRIVKSSTSHIFQELKVHSFSVFPVLRRRWNGQWRHFSDPSKLNRLNRQHLQHRQYLMPSFFHEDIIYWNHKSTENSPTTCPIVFPPTMFLSTCHVSGRRPAFVTSNQSSFHMLCYHKVETEKRTRSESGELKSRGPLPLLSGCEFAFSPTKVVKRSFKFPVAKCSVQGWKRTSEERIRTKNWQHEWHLMDMAFSDLMSVLMDRSYLFSLLSFTLKYSVRSMKSSVPHTSLQASL